ncbi:ketopantoate reductase family protein [Chloroflexota bacterium]
MKIVIIGSGNIGGLLGVLLTKSGHDVTLVEIRDEVVDTIKSEGVRLDLSNGKTIQSKLKITKDIKSVDIPDLVILAVKSYATQGAVEGIKSIIGENTWIMSVQNGAGNIEIITKALGDNSHIIGGIFLCVVTPIKINQLSWVVGTGGLKFGPVNGVMSQMIDDVAEIFRKTGIDVFTSDKVQNLIWGKVLQNVPLALGTALRITNDEFIVYPHAKELIIKMAQECVDVSKAMGIMLDQFEDPIKTLVDTMQKFHDSGTKPKCSMLQDLESGKKTEIDTINGSIVREGKRLGIATPVNEVMVMLVKIQEEKNCT